MNFMLGLKTLNVYRLNYWVVSHNLCCTLKQLVKSKFHRHFVTGKFKQHKL